MDQGLLTGAVFIDLRKAFDSVDHDLLISKLQSYGLKNIELNWFKSYLLDRKQVVRIGTETSDYCTITSEAPQGSILGPLLLVLFINDLPKVLTKCRILMYADDTVMYFSAADSQVIADTLTNELLLVNKWLIDNNLFMHEGKTECMLFGTGPKLALSTSFSIALTPSFSAKKMKGMVALIEESIDKLMVKVEKVARKGTFIFCRERTEASGETILDNTRASRR